MQNDLPAIAMASALVFVSVPASAETAQNLLQVQIDNLKKELKSANSELDTIRKDVELLRNQLKTTAGDNSGPVSSSSGSAETHQQLHLKYPAATCPPGQYVAGVKTWGSVAAGRGDLVAVQVLCRAVIP